jgi:hypothetical protein
MERWLSSVSRPVVVERGVGTAIQFVRCFSQRAIHSYVGRLVRINPREFNLLTRLDVGLASGSMRALLEIDQLFDFDAWW